jgi:hypothetical protein
MWRAGRLRLARFCLGLPGEGEGEGLPALAGGEVKVEFHWFQEHRLMMRADDR